MMDLGRVTTVYVDVEDRFRLSGETQDGQVLVLWLTQRLLCRLVPHLVRWLDQRAPLQASSPAVAAAAQVMHAFAQQSALARIGPQEPVQAAQARADWLVQKVDVSTAPQAVRLMFRPLGNSNETAGVTMEATHLRQWLGIVHGQWRQAGWPQEVWPQWMLETAPAPVASGGTTVWH